MFAHNICNNVSLSLRSLYVNMGFIVEAFVVPFICVLGFVGNLAYFLLYGKKVIIKPLG